MAAITYGTPPEGGFLATVPGTAGFGGPGGGGSMGWIAEAARRSAANKLRKQELELKMLEESYRHRPGPNAGKSLAQQEAERATYEAQAEAARTESAKAIAKRGTAPKKWIGGSGYGFGATIEAPEDYTGVQREIFLPQGSSLTGPSLPEMDEAGRNRSISDMQRMKIEDAETEAVRRGLASRGGLGAPNPSIAAYDWTMSRGQPEDQPEEALDIYGRRRMRSAPAVAPEQSWDDWARGFGG